MVPQIPIQEPFSFHQMTCLTEIRQHILALLIQEGHVVSKHWTDAELGQLWEFRQKALLGVPALWRSQKSPMTRLTGPLTLTVRHLTGQEISLSVQPTHTVADLKQEIQIKEGIPSEQQRLIYEGVQLEDTVQLEAYGITQSATIHLVLYLRGGMSPFVFSPLDHPLQWTGERSEEPGCHRDYICDVCGKMDFPGIRYHLPYEKYCNPRKPSQKLDVCEECYPDPHKPGTKPWSEQVDHCETHLVFPNGKTVIRYPIQDGWAFLNRNTDFPAPKPKKFSTRDHLVEEIVDQGIMEEDEEEDMNEAEADLAEYQVEEEEF